MAAPANLKYLATHEWVRLEGPKATLGITDFAVGEIKDIVFVDLPAAGTAVKAGESFGAIETVKAAFDLYAPVTGTVTAVNAALAGAPETVSKDPFGAGWMLEVQTTDGAGDLAKLLDAPAYEKHCAEHKH